MRCNKVVTLSGGLAGIACIRVGAHAYVGQVPDRLTNTPVLARVVRTRIFADVAITTCNCRIRQITTTGPLCLPVNFLPHLHTYPAEASGKQTPCMQGLLAHAFSSSVVLKHPDWPTPDPEYPVGQWHSTNVELIPFRKQHRTAAWCKRRFRWLTWVVRALS